MSSPFIRRTTGIGAGLATIFATALMSAPPATAGGNDSDGDGMPNRWERAHGLRVHQADAGKDPDHDQLSNLKEYLRDALPQDEDSDNDGHDDGDEVHDDSRSTDVDDSDSDDDGTEDGDEDSDRDGEDNEDEDDASENCRADDDDRDEDSVDDEDENELRILVHDADSDDDGIDDGDEDRDEDGESNEDEDDSDLDECDGDEDGDGEDDEDSDDVMGTITGYDSTTMVLTVQPRTSELAMEFNLTDETEVEWDDHSGPGGGDASTDDLQVGVRVVELEIEDDEGTVEEIEIAPAELN